MNAVIVIPARFGSTRFPGKPLIKIAGKSLLEHVCASASLVANVKVLVATDDERIMRHAHELNVDTVMTPTSCASGTDRILNAISQLTDKPKYVINLQGDAPLTPPIIIQQLLDTLQTHDIVTPVMQLGWSELDILRNSKQQNPFSGTTAIVNTHNNAIWFSKHIIPAIREEEKLRKTMQKSPVFQHLGIYGYSLKMLELFASLPPSHYETLEGLEQLRFLENGYSIKAVPITLSNLNAWRGVDTPEDAQFVEQLILAGKAT